MIHRLFWTLLQLLTLTVSAQEPPRPPDEITSIIEGVSTAYGALKDAEIPFRQEKLLTILKEPLKSSGTTLWRPGRMLFRTTDPSPSEVLITDAEILIWVPELEQIERYDRAHLKVMEAMDLGIGQNLSAMTHAYRIERTPCEEGFVSLKMTPTDEQIAKFVRTLSVRIRLKEHRITQVEYVDTSGDTTRTCFDVDQMKIDQGLTDSDIVLGAPDDTPVVEPLQPDTP